MNPWGSATRWINTLLLFIVGFIGFHVLFVLLNANSDNGIVAFVAAVAGLFLAPFDGMFNEDSELLTALVAVLGYCLLAGIALGITRSVRASRADRAANRAAGQREATSQRRVDPDATRRL